MPVFYTAQVMGEGGYFDLCDRKGETRYFDTEKAARAAASRKVRQLGPDIALAGARVFMHEYGVFNGGELVAQRSYYTEWR